MTQIEELREQLGKLKARKREYQEKMKTAPAAEKPGISLKIRSLGSAITSVQEQLDYLDPPAQRKAQAKRKRLEIGGLGFDWFERNKVAWSDLDGHSWAQAENGDFIHTGKAEEAREWMAQAAARLTPKQALYLDAYYNQGLSLARIAEENRVLISTVSVTIRRGLQRMQAWIDAKRRIETCHTAPEVFELAEYISGVPGTVITPRQRELMLVVLSGSAGSQKDVAVKLEMDSSTVSRTLTLGGEALNRLGVPRTESIGRRPDLGEWNMEDKFSIPQKLGMGLGLAYKFDRTRINGMTRYMYELHRRMLAGQTAQETADELQLSVSCVRAAYCRLKQGGTTHDRA